MDSNSPSRSSILVRVDYVASDTSDREDENIKIPTEKKSENLEKVGKSKHKKRKLPPTQDIDQPSLQITEPPKKRQAKSVTSPAVEEAVGEEDLPPSTSIPKKKGRKPRNLAQTVKESTTPKQVVEQLNETAQPIDSIQQDENSSLIAESPQVSKKRGRPKKTSLDATPKQVDQKLNNQVADSMMETSHNHEENSSLMEESPRVIKKRGRKPKSFYLDTVSTSYSGSQLQLPEKAQPPTELILEMNGNSVMNASCNDLTPDTPTTTNGPKKRGRKPKTPQIHSAGTPMVSTPPATPVSAVRKSVRTPKTPVDYAEHENTPTTSKRTKKTAAPVDPLSLSDDETIEDQPVVKAKKVVNNVVCGVCKEEMPEPSFTYHKYKMHHGLARLEGESQEFTDKERSQELKKTIEKLKRVTCAKCPKVFTTWGGLGYHLERCGRDAAELENMSVECEICGKRVMALAAHLKIHSKNATNNQIEDKTALEITSELLATPGTKSKRAAAQKAVKLLREVADDSGEISKKEGKKTLGMFVEPTASKVTNSIICAWKRQIAQDSVAKCRYASCTFTSDKIEQLSAHHGQCEIGLKTKAFACRKCSFHCPDRNGIIEHVLNTHVSEKDAAFEMSGGESSNDDADDFSGHESVNEDTEDDRNSRRKSIPQNTKILDKAYGLPASILQQFKSMTTPPLIPMILAQFHKKNFTWNGALYQDWRPKIKSLSDLKEYLPTQEMSIPFARRVVSSSNLFPTSTAVTYERLSKFHGVLQTTTNTPMFFCGGAIQSAVWCPMPMPMVDIKMEERDQYLAVSVFKDEDMYRSPSQCPFESKYALQIWNCGKLSNSVAAPTAPLLELLLAHSFGRVWSLNWCPSGCYDESRLGLLAASCSDGSVRVFSVPHPRALPNVLLQSFPCNLQVSTAITLKLSMNEKSECTTLHWDETYGHRYIVAGFANGVVALWDIQAKSPALLNGDVLFPVWSFYAHNSIITAVSLSPHHNDGRFVATASSDRSLKLWDRFDTVPVCWSKRSRVTDIKWRRHWPGVVVCVEDYFSLFKAASLFYDFGYTGNRQALLSQNSVAWCAAENEYMDIIAHSTDAGEVVIYASHLAVIECDEKKLKKQRKIVLRTDLVDIREAETVYLNRMDKILTQNINKKNIIKKEIREAPLEYSLIFNDVTTVIRSINSKQQSNKANLFSDMLDVLMPCDKPLPSLKQISFNPNFECHTWMFACGENGLVQLLRIDSPSLPKIADTYLKELNK